MADDLVSVLFLRDHRPFNAGEKAGVPPGNNPGEASYLEARGVVWILGAEEVAAGVPKPDTRAEAENVGIDPETAAGMSEAELRAEIEQRKKKATRAADKSARDFSHGKDRK